MTEKNSTPQVKTSAVDLAVSELNSFDVMNIVCAFEEYFDVTIPTRDVWKMHQVKDVIKYMEDKGIDLPKK